MNPTQAKRLGNYLRRAREQAGLSQAGLAKRIGVDNTRILRLERGDTRFPSPEFLSSVASELQLNVLDVYARARFTVPSDLPTLSVYLRSKYQDLPESATDAITAYAERLAKRHGVQLAGPQPGEDEQPVRAMTTTTKKGAGGGAGKQRRH